VARWRKGGDEKHEEHHRYDRNARRLRLPFAHDEITAIRNTGSDEGDHRRQRLTGEEGDDEHRCDDDVPQVPSILGIARRDRRNGRQRRGTEVAADFVGISDQRVTLNVMRDTALHSERHPEIRFFDDDEQRIDDRGGKRRGNE